MGAFFNGADCDIYIGTGAGAKLLKDIRNAKKSIMIVSPYLSPSLVKELIEIRRNNIKVQLITTDEIKDFTGPYEKNIHKLIIQHQSLDRTAKEQRDKWISLAKKIRYMIITLVCCLGALTYYLRDIRLLWGIIPTVLLICLYEYYKYKIKNKRIYYYKYTQLFPFKVYISPPNNNGGSIHSKIYLIDDAIAYLGSLNFTVSGTRLNYETRVRTMHPDAIMEIKREFNTLFYDSGLSERNIQMWGRSLYNEPIN